MRQGVIRKRYGRIFISIHAPVKGATRVSKILSTIQRISIHAPVKGATKTRSLIKARLNISIHAPVKGATHGKCFVIQKTTYFNPRTREGCDANAERRLTIIEEISIHAPVKGATFIDYNSKPNEIISIHAPVKGATKNRA